MLSVRKNVSCPWLWSALLESPSDIQDKKQPYAIIQSSLRKMILQAGKCIATPKT